MSYTDLDSLFNPRSIAVVGVTTSRQRHWTNVLWDALLEFNFDGQLYPINLKGGELDGRQVYRNLEEVPGNIDYVIGIVPAKVAPLLIADAARKGVKHVHLCTSGFSETGETEMAGLETNLASLCRKTGVRLIGPNSMGIYCPKSRLSFDTGFSKQSGNVAFISQSGGNSIYVINEASWRGVKFSKVISFGNACDLNECDFLEYLTCDDDTKVIAIYIEGVKEGKRFFRALRDAAMKKPVVILKGGTTEGGFRAAMSHTASMAGDGKAWNAMFQQAGAMTARRIEELIDILITLTFMPDIQGNNVAMIGPGGGVNVLATDEFESKGLRLPAMPDEIRKQILEYTPIAGNMLRNPIDYSQSFMEAGKLHKTISILSSWDEIDCIIGFIRPSQAPFSEWEAISAANRTMLEAYLVSTKPIGIVCELSVLPERQEIMYGLLTKLVSAQIPIYYSFQGAAKAISSVIKFNEKRRYGNLYNNLITELTTDIKHTIRDRISNFK